MSIVDRSWTLQFIPVTVTDTNLTKPISKIIRNIKHVCMFKCLEFN